MEKDYLRGLDDNEVMVALRASFELALTEFPEGKSILYSTKKHEYLIRKKDKRLIAVDKEPVLDKIIAGAYESPNKGCVYKISDLMDVPLDSIIIFFEDKDFSNRSEDSFKVPITLPIYSIGWLTEEEALRYLEKPSIKNLLN